MRRSAALAAIVLAVSGLACTGQAPAQPTVPPDLTVPTPAPDATLPEVTVPPDMTLPPPGEVPADLFQQVADQAAAIAGVPVGELTVVRAEAVTWNDGSLGCPEPGQMYTQALVDGYWIVLRAGDQEFDFRADQQGQIKVCPPGQGRPPLEP